MRVERLFWRLAFKASPAEPESQKREAWDRRVGRFGIPIISMYDFISLLRATQISFHMSLRRAILLEILRVQHGNMYTQENWRET